MSNQSSPWVFLSTDLKQCVAPCSHVLYVPSCSGLVHLNGLLGLALHVKQSRLRTPADRRFPLETGISTNCHQLTSLNTNQYEERKYQLHGAMSVTPLALPQYGRLLPHLYQSVFKPVLTRSWRTVQLLYLNQLGILRCLIVMCNLINESFTFVSGSSYQKLFL